ncbi:MAG: hypothetical protein ACPGSO_06625 [Vicingaceae bacterium]
MKKFLFILIVLVVLSPKVNAQNYAEEHYQFDSIYKTIEGYYNRGLYFKAAQLPEKLKDNRYVNASVHFFFARVYSLSNEFDKTLFSLKNAVERGISKEYINQMYDLDNFRKSNLNVIFESSYPSWHQTYLDKRLTLDSNYIKEIRTIRQRYKADLKMKDIDGNEVVEIKDSLNFYKIKNKFDSLCFNSVVNLTLERGFPIKKKIGRDYYWYSSILRYNMPVSYDVNTKDWLKIKKMINSEMQKGTVLPYYYAAIEDNKRVSRKKPQLYGTTLIVYSGNKDVSHLLEFENPEELNLRRKSVGLCSIQLELWSKARELPESLKNVEFK